MEENEVITEKEYLNRCNETLKQQLLETTSSDSEAEAELSAEDEELANDSDSSNDSNLPPLVDKFLEDLTVNEFDKEGNDESNTKESEIICDVEPKDVVIFADDESENEQVVKDNSNGSVVVVSPAATATASSSGVIADNKKDSILMTEKIENKIENHNTSEDEKKSSEKEKTSTRINVGYSRRLLSEKNFDIKAIENAASIQKDSVVGKDESEDSDCEILHDSLLKKPRKEKTLDVLLAEYDKRRKNTKVDESAISLSSESASELDEGINEEEEESQRRVLKPMLRQDQLAGETRIAQKEEYERLRRLDKKQEFLAKALKEYYKDVDKEKRSKELILDYNSETKTFIKVNPDIVKQLKKHQVEGVKFMYDVCYGSVEFLKKHPGSGCILAHCMGLGKTLQLIALLHTVITYKELKTSKILVLCPKSTVMNWKDEIQRWLGPISPAQLKVYSFPDTSDIQEKLRLLQEWSTLGTTGNRKAGCFLMGYEAFRTLVFYHLYKKQKNCLTASDLDAIKRKVKETLLHPGADLVICDEGHIIKNRKSAISTAVAEIKTLRRIILTGTPIQNNLKEYYSMVNFIKPSFLGTEREFANLYANPIRCGQHKDSSKKEIKIMKQRSFVLHKKLSKFVQRREAALLKSFLPEKYEYVLFIPMTNVQNALYEFFLNSISMREGAKGKNLIPDYTCLRKIWTHPKVLENAWQNAIIAKNRRESKKTPTRINSDDEEPDDIYDSQTGALSVTKDWWRPLILDKDLLSLLASNKLRVMFEILRMCGENGEKCLIFSAFVAVLNVVEYFMKQIHSKDLGRIPPSPDLGLGNFKGPWVEGEDYYRLDGKTPKSVRHEMVKMFNDPENRRARCFLISAKAGGQGINLIGANRVIILDTSWNPSNDQQNIFRIFRLGQKRECFVYRLLTMGTMEEKVYSRSVTKQAMSFRVVDEQQIDRHYSMAELQELYTLTKPNYADRPVPPRPMDNVLASLLHNFPSMVFKYHEHDSLLENKLEQELSEQEKADAWNAYELDLQAQANAGLPPPPIDNMGMFPGAANFLPPFAGFTGRNYPISYAPGMHGPIPPQLLPPYYNSSNAIMDIYNMYQNFPVSAGPLMSRLNSTNPMNNGHPYQSAANSLLGPPNSMTNPNMNMLPPGMNNLSALTALPPFSSLSSMPQSTSNNTLTSQSPVYSTINNITPQFHSPPSSVDSFRRFLETNNQRPTLDMGSQQKATNSHQVTSAESIPTSVITNSDIHFGQFRDHLGESSDQRSSPKANLMQKTGSASLPASSLSQMLTSNARSNQISTQGSNQQTAKRGGNMGILYPVHSSAKLPDNVGPGGNISVRSVNSINNATNNTNYISSSVTATPVNSLNKAPVTYPIVDRNISRGPTTSLQSSITPVLNKEPAVINAASNKSFGNVNQIQLSSYQAAIKKPTKNNTNAVTSIASTNNNNNNNSNGVSIRALHPSSSSSSSVTPSKIVTNKPSTSSISKPVINQIITSPKVSNNVMKTASKSIVQSSSSSPLNSNSAKSFHGNSIRTKIVHRPMSSNLSPASVITKPSISNTSQNSIRPNHTVNVPNTPKGNQTISGTTILPAMNKSRSQVLATSSGTNKTSTLQNPVVEAQKQQARNNAALNSLSGRNNISIRPVENKFNNPGITISPGRKIPVGAATSSTSVKSTNSSGSFTNNVTSLLKDAVSRKRPSSSNITLMLPDNSPISVRQIKRPKLVSVTPPSLGVRNTTDPLARVQTNQGLTIVPRSAQNNQRLPPKEGKTPEVVEID